MGDPLLSLSNSQRFDKDTTGSLRLSVDIHPGHVRFSVALNHAQKFPAVALIETGMVGDQIGRRNALGAQILNGHVQKISGNSLAAVAFLGVDRADIGGHFNLAGFSLFHYYRLFQQATGMAVMHYIQRRRLLHGVYAMKQGIGKTDAALAYGFDTYAGFYKAFCREFGATPSGFLKSSRAKRPYRIDIIREEHMMITHKKAARILTHWNLGDAAITDIYYEGTGNKNDSAVYVGEEFVLKYTVNFGKLEKHIEVSKALSSIGLLSAVPVPTADGGGAQSHSLYHPGQPVRLCSLVCPAG